LNYAGNFSVKIPNQHNIGIYFLGNYQYEAKIWKKINETMMEFHGKFLNFCHQLYFQSFKTRWMEKY